MHACIPPFPFHGGLFLTECDRSNRGATQGGVGYVLYSEVFAPDSKTTYFNRAVDRIRKDPRCLELLGDGKRITAFGEETHNKWRRARPIAYGARILAG